MKTKWRLPPPHSPLPFTFQENFVVQWPFWIHNEYLFNLLVIHAPPSPFPILEIVAYFQVKQIVCNWHQDISNAFTGEHIFPVTTCIRDMYLLLRFNLLQQKPKCANKTNRKIFTACSFFLKLIFLILDIQPADASRLVGSNVTFICTLDRFHVDHRLSSRHMYFTKGDNVQSARNYSQHEYIIDADSLALVLDDLTLLDRGTIYCNLDETSIGGPHDRNVISASLSVGGKKAYCK